MKTLQNAIAQTKVKLIVKAKQKGGIYEGFGQSEIRAIKEKFKYHSELLYGNEQQRLQVDEIDAFGDWCETLSDKDLK